MSIRALLALLLSISLATLFACIYFMARFLEDSILNLLPPTLASQTNTAIHLLVLEQFAGLVLFSLILTAILFWIFGRLIAKPLGQLSTAMAAFALDGTQVQLPMLSETVNEIKSLAEAFVSFADKVSEVHKKDSEISRVKSDFISTAAHQLRTPLTGIRWALEALEKENLTEDQKMLVKNATDKSHDLVAIVGTLLDISSIESGKYKYVLELTDISELISNITKDFSPLAQKSNVELYYSKSSDPLPLLRVDTERIKWVLNNLVENAIRYTPAPGHVRITTECNANLLYIRVKDSGIGIDAKDRSNIFERFYRAGNAITKENQGNGLGLYIARTIATDHGGDLNFINNKEGPGTTFVLSLPIAP